MEFISLKPKVTKDFILSKINQESIIHYYTGIEVNSKKLFLSPVRNDNKVTCGIYKSKSGILYIHDFATNEHLDCWNLVMRLYNCDYFQALNKIAQEQGCLDSGYRVIVNCGKDAGQEVMHLHYHLLAGAKMGDKIV